MALHIAGFKAGGLKGFKEVAVTVASWEDDDDRFGLWCAHESFSTVISKVSRLGFTSNRLHMSST